MILLQANQVARLFGDEVLFQNIQLEVQDRSRIALVGRNGTGKSTLLKILAGIEEADQGAISKTKDLTMGYLDQHTGLESTKTIWEEMLTVFEPIQKMERRLRELENQISDVAVQENVKQYEQVLNEYDRLQHKFNDLNGYGYESEIKSVLHGFRFDESYLNHLISNLSGGQKTRLALAKLLLEKPDLLILDEPTNHLDIETLGWLENYLQNYRGALLIVSHDRYFLDKIVQEVYEISRMKISHYKGNYSRYLDQKAERLEREWKEFEKQQVEISKLEDFVAKNLVRASTTKRAQSRRKQLEKMDRMDRPQGDEKSAHFLFGIERQSGREVLEIEQAAIGYDNTILCEPIDFQVRKQESIALVGPNGVGKSTLLKTIIDELPLIKGEKKLGHHVTVGYYDQEQANLTSHQSILEELWSDHRTTPEKDIRTILGSFLFSGEDVKKTIPLLSGGEKARVALAKLSMNRDNFLILDEPTNHLDIDSKEVLENALIDYEGTLLFVSHDRYFINRIATSILELSEEGSKLYHGNYDYYLEKKLEEEQLRVLLNEDISDVSEVVTDTKKNFVLDKQKQKEKRQLERQVEQLEIELHEIEEVVDTIQKEMEIPSNLEDHEVLKKLNDKLNESFEKQEKLLEDWENMSLELEEFE
ncbi:MULTISPECIES: ABC-F family ATP-binding cassette domain-containing protein [Vagococcus]|uniref:ABC transporter ATP-binding protein uup n=1 Tax=Vagococcus fluvialis bH819 TaxID=1255619 RepID=A0A1X6WMG2_9ENTE|nr:MULTISPECIES: ABC-F type ribosomal protection protein [Vagococcus]SLM85457.1 ABC transporter ATP-binding protein uup [Vagococcus fluvialis bH819]HCM89250.1 ABC transporter ATP-binding protein [Vagococcus sp.]